MHPQLLENYKELESTRELVMSQLENVDIEILQKKPTPENWSVVQLINHLILAERMSLGYIIKKYPAVGELDEVGLKQNLAMKTMKLAQLSSKKFKAPAPVSQPKEDSSLETLKKEWEKVQVDLKEFLDQYPDKHLKRALYKHPFIGRISLVQMMKVHVYHILRHKAQIDRILKNFK